MSGAIHCYLALKNSPQSGVSDSMAWLLAMSSLLRCFHPVCNFNRYWAHNAIVRPLQKHPVSTGVIALTTTLFFIINQGGLLPEYAMDNLAFTASAPLWQWPWRSVTSDLIYFDRTHFLLSSLALLVSLRWMEKTHTIRFTVLLVVLTSIFDDIINQLVLVWPYSFIHPRLFQTLIASKDVGTSLWISTFIGLQICSIKKNREILFTILSLGVVLCFAFSAAKLSNLVLNLNHFLFLSIGYVVGKLKFEYERKQSRKVAQMKAPVSKSTQVAAERRRQSREKPETSSGTILETPE